MHSNLPPSNPGEERFINSPANPTVRPAGITPFKTVQQDGPVRMDHSNGNYQQNKNLQQPQQQHYIMQQNHLRQQQPHLRSSDEDMIKQQAKSAYNSSVENNPRGPGVGYEGQRIQMPPPVKFPGPQQPVRPPTNPNAGIQLSKPNLPNYQRCAPPRPSIGQIQENIQNAAHPENDITQDPRDSPVFSRNPPNLKILPQNNLNQKPSENQPEMTGQPGNLSTQNSVPGERTSHPLLMQTPASITPESTSEPTEPAVKKRDLETSEKEKGRDTKLKKRGQKESKSMEYDSITSGTVQRNIKFFEQNDTSKMPLMPGKSAVKKKEKIAAAPPDVIKSDNHKDDYDSGVDESPVVHPNLGSIFQAPRKVAKISRTRTSKRRNRSEVTSRKGQIYQRPTLSEFLKPRHSYLPFGLRGRRTRIPRSYGSKEELLAFFENTKYWREMKCYGSKVDQNAAKDKLVHKPTTNGDIPTPKKTPSKLQTPLKKNPPVSPSKTPLKSPGTPGVPGTPGTKSLPKTPDSPAPSTPLIKKVPMNKIHVGAAPSPNLKTVKSKVGSLANTTHKPGGGNVKIETHKIDLSNVQPRTEAKNDQYKPSGGDKKIQQVKLQWTAKSKVGSLENANYKPSGGEKKIESVKLDFKERAKPKVGSKENVKHVPGGGNVKIENQKLEFKAQSKVGSLDNVKHKPGGGDIKIFDDKTYLRQVSGTGSEGRLSGTQACGDLSVVREVEGRSAPDTPGRRTSVKIKKITRIQSFEETPKVENITEVTVTSQTPKKKNKMEKSPTKQQVKVTYSKISTSKSGDSPDIVGIIKLPANSDAPILKPRLTKTDESSEKYKQTKSTDNKIDFSKSFTNVRNSGNLNLDSPSEVKPNVTDDAGLSRFMRDGYAAEEGVEDLENKSNAFSNRQHREQQRQQFQNSFLETYASRNAQQFRSQNPEIINDTHINSTDSGRLNFHTNQNMQSEQHSTNPSLLQSQQGQQNHH